MKKVPAKETEQDDLLPVYRFDYAKAKPNRFAAAMKDSAAVVLAPDVAAVFGSSDAVNGVLRAIIASAGPSLSGSGVTGPEKRKSTSK